jgi:hypothetical protein
MAIHLSTKANETAVVSGYIQDGDLWEVIMWLENKTSVEWEKLISQITVVVLGSNGIAI